MEFFERAKGEEFVSCRMFARYMYALARLGNDEKVDLVYKEAKKYKILNKEICEVYFYAKKEAISRAIKKRDMDGVVED